ncbi:hypothetical protein [Nocardioides convexus]|uniref:hypothetical protein n=1 Tax=Nocardioides convexus TaxID=2712224 RepID=UPI00241896C1|nr:hypothetical protein [Nocardioides convexus]
MRQGSGTTLDAQRFAQVGTWEGTISVDGTDLAVTPDRWVGSRDRSWGIRPVGEAAPPGKPADPAFKGMWWLYVPMRFEEFCVVLIIQETPDGFRTLNDCTRVWREGRVEQTRLAARHHPLHAGHPRAHRRDHRLHDSRR